MKMTRTEQWFDKHPPLFAYVACLIAYSAKPVAAILSLIHNDPSVRSAVKASPETWAMLYRQHRRLRGVLTQSLCTYAVNQGNFGFAEKLIFRYAVHEILKDRPPSKRKSPHLLRRLLLDLIRSGKGILFHHFVKVVEAQEASDVVVDSTDVVQMEEVAFFMSVLLPCWFEYDEALLPLFRRARRGDITAIEKILWLDKDAVHDAVIARHLREASENPECPRNLRMVGALETRPKVEISRARVKVWTAGLVALIGDLSDCSLPQPAIRELYDALAYDLDGSAADHDLPEDDAFRVALNREKDFWKPFARQTIAYLLS